MLTDAREDLTAFAAFPPAHWTKIWSTNPLITLPPTVPNDLGGCGIARRLAPIHGKDGAAIPTSPTAASGAWRCGGSAMAGRPPSGW
jgi:hypothetical protein